MVKNIILESIAWDRTPTSQTMYAIWGFVGLLVEHSAWYSKHSVSIGYTSITVEKTDLG